MQNIPVSARRNVNFFRHENGTSIDQINSEKNIIHCKTQYKNNIFHPHAKKSFQKAKMKKMRCSFRPWFSSRLWHFLLINKNWKMYETAIPMGKMLNAFLAIHGRCKFIFFLRGQTPSLSAPTLILSLMEHFEGKAKNTVKHSIKSTFSISIQLNCNWLPGNPQLSPYIYMYIHTHIYNMYIHIYIYETYP